MRCLQLSNRPLSIALLAILGLGIAACGEVGRVEVNLEFAEDDLELRTRNIGFAVRVIIDPSTEDCGDIWNPENPGGRAEGRSILPYPLANDAVVAPVDLEAYEFLGIFAYAWSELTPETQALFEVPDGVAVPALTTDDLRPALAGGCIPFEVVPDRVGTLDLQLEANPN